MISTQITYTHSSGREFNITKLIQMEAAGMVNEHFFNVTWSNPVEAERTFLAIANELEHQVGISSSKAIKIASRITESLHSQIVQMGAKA